MSFVLSSVVINSLSSELAAVDFSYFNHTRQFTNLSALSTINNVPSVIFNALGDIKDLVINNNALIFLTDTISLSSFLTNSLTISSYKAGSSNISYFNKYFSDNTVDIAQQYPYKNNYLIVCPFKSSLKYNIIPLKTMMTTNYEYDLNDVELGIPTRKYDAIYFGNNQEFGYDTLFAQYRASHIPIQFPNDVYTTVHIPDNVQSFALSSAGFVKNGAFAGEGPTNSDIIFYERFGYGKFNNSGANELSFNGVPLCLWLSGGQWAERWYDPNLVTQGNALIAAVNTDPLNPIKDIVSRITIKNKEKISYLRYGPERNSSFVQSFSSDLVFHFDRWSSQLQDEVYQIKGYSVGNYDGEETDILNMTGSFHMHIPPNSSIQIEQNISNGIWVHKNDWTTGIDTQLFGNFSNNEGYGLFYNTGAQSEMITFPTISGNIYGFNQKGVKVFEKPLLTTLGVSAVSITQMTTDLFGARWLFDNHSKCLYKLDTDDILTEKITLPSSANITKLQINSQNHVFAMNTTNRTISGFDTLGDNISKQTFAAQFNNFEINAADTVVLGLGNEMTIDNNGDAIKAFGVNLFKNSTLFYHVGKKILALRIDSSNNYWILYDSKRLLKMTSDGNIIFDKILSTPFETETSVEMDFVREQRGDSEKDILWIVFNTNRFVEKVDENGNEVKKFNIRDVVNLKSCGDFQMRVAGDFSGFDSKRKFAKFSDGSLITSRNPAITLKINLYCGSSASIYQLHYPAKKLSEWTHIGFTHEFTNSSTILRLYVNGVNVTTKTISGLKKIYYGSKVSPFIVGGHSGKLGAKNVERGMTNEGYFIGKVDDLRLYNKPLSVHKMRSLYLNKFYNNWEEMTWFCPSPETTYMEEIQDYHLHRYPGHKSNKYNLKIKNLNIEDPDTIQIIKDSVLNIIERISPVHTELNEIIFE